MIIPETILSFIPFDQYQRYHFIRRVVEAVANGPADRILEVGGAYSPLRELLPQKTIVIVDEEKAPNLNLYAGGLRLPFQNKSFDVVVCTDVLEHVKAAERALFLQETLRITSRVLILGFPHNSPAVSEAEKDLLQFVRDVSGKEHRFLSEHLENGLPVAAEIKETLRPLVSEILEFGNSNLPIWLAMMKSNFLMEEHPELGEVRALLNNVFNNNFETQSHTAPAYRTFFLCFLEPLAAPMRKKLQELEVQQRNLSTADYSAFSLALVNGFHTALQKEKHRGEATLASRQEEITQLKAGLENQKEQNAALQQQSTVQLEEIAAKDQQLSSQEHLLQQQSARIENLQQYLNLFLKHPAYKVYRFFKDLFRRS